MAKKDAKAKAAEKRAVKAARQLKKADKKEKKGKAKGKDEDTSDEDVDLEVVLAEYAKQQEKFLKVVEEVSEPPSPRSSSTLVASPSNDNELFIFGGEHFNGALATFYNDLYVYQIRQAQWKRVTSPNSPLPRSGHAWTRGGNAGGVYLYGGEFSSPKQNIFYHYNDFWRLEPGTHEWTRIESKGKGPPARSGHRMTYFKNYIILFGGFQDTSQSTKYLQDLWLYDTQNYNWQQPTLPPAGQKPDARSSFSLLPHESGAVLYGGYSRVKTILNGGTTKTGAKRQALKPQIHQDTWFLRITPPPDISSSAPPTVRWERRKRAANAPNPPRAGATMAYHKSRGICFGGVHDVEESEEGIESEFFGTIFAWNIDRNRFFPLTLRRPRTGPKKVALQGERGGKRGRGKADEEELLRNLARLETTGTLEGDIESKSMEIDLGVGAEDEQEARVEQPVLNTLPHPRFNAQLTVQDDVLYIFGGTYERGDREFTLDEMYAVDLGKLDGVKQIFHRELEDWLGSEEESSEDEEDEGEEEDDSEKDEMDIDSAPPSTPSILSSAPTIPSIAAPETELEDEVQVPLAADNRPHPRPFETLRDFYARTSAEWQEIEMEDLKRHGLDIERNSIKELKKRGFEQAEQKWWDVREEIMAMEDEQEQAGIGEVVNLGEQKSTGAGRRR